MRLYRKPITIGKVVLITVIMAVIMPFIFGAFNLIFGEPFFDLTGSDMMLYVFFIAATFILLLFDRDFERGKLLSLI